MTNELSPNDRWEQGIPHDPRSEELARALAEIDYQYDDYFCLKFGGDGDNGEELLYLLDIYFERQDRKNYQSHSSACHECGRWVL